MKSDRRHDLQQNDLDKVIKGLPTFFEVYGNRIMIGVIVVSVLIFAIRWRINTTRETKRAAEEALAVARASLQEMLVLQPMGQAPEMVAQTRTQMAQDVRGALEVLTRNTEDRKMLAEALIARGDLNWQIANFVPLPAATTRPALNPEQTPEQALATAEQAYQQVVDNYKDQTLAVVSAKFGLAAIAENRGQWDKAKQQYESVVNTEAAGPAFREQAKRRLELLKELQTPVYIVATSQPVVAAPTTAPGAAATQATVTAPEAAAPVAPATTQVAK